MMSAILLAERRQDPVESRVRMMARSLSALVPLVVGDIVADATIVTHGDIDLSAVEQSAGCGSECDDNLGAALMRAATRARRDRLLLLCAGYAPDASFPDEIVSAIENDPPGQARVLRAEAETFLHRLLPHLAPPVVIAVPRSAIVDAKPSGAVTLARLAKTLTARPMRARAIRV